MPYLHETDKRPWISRQNVARRPGPNSVAGCFPTRLIDLPFYLLPLQSHARDPSSQHRKIKSTHQPQLSSAPQSSAILLHSTCTYHHPTSLPLPCLPIPENKQENKKTKTRQSQSIPLHHQSQQSIRRNKRERELKCDTDSQGRASRPRSPWSSSSARP
jgi:hypothetical protein